MKFNMRLAIPIAILAFAATSSVAHPSDLTKRYVVPREEWTNDCKYVSKNFIYDLWHTSDGDFYRHFHEEIDWDIMFAQPLSGHYGNLTLFIVNGLLRLANTFDGPFNFTLVNIIGGCNDAWSVQETLIQANLKNGLRCDEVVVWATRWDPDDKRVRQVRTYVDSGWTTTAILGNEASTNASWRDTRTDFIPGPYGMPNLTEILGFPQGNPDLATPLASTTSVLTTPLTDIGFSTDNVKPIPTPKA